MSTRGIKLILICEDSQQRSFALRFLKGMGFSTRDLRAEISPSGKGSAEQWVKEIFPFELKYFRARRNKASVALIVMIDADTKTATERIQELENACTKNDMQFRKDGEEVAIIIPTRNIETWIHFLNGSSVNETDAYPRLDKESSCQPAVQSLIRMCKNIGLKPDAPDSLKAACNEYNTRIKSQI